MAHYGLSERQVADRLDAEYRAVQLNERLSPLYSKEFGGAYFDASENRLVVVAKDPNSELAQTALRMGAAIAVSRFDVKDLHGIAASLVEQANSHGLGEAIAGFHLDPVKGKVVLEILSTGANSFVDVVLSRVSLEALDAIDVVPVSGLAEPLSSVDGASRIHTTTSNGQSFNVCSTGFGVDGGFLTAAHCGFVGYQARTPAGVVMGTFTGSTLQAVLPACSPGDPYNTDAFPTSDQAVVSLNSPFWATYAIVPYSFGQMRVKGTSAPLVGTSVCRFGETTGGPHCGQVTSTDAYVYFDFNRRVQITNLIRATVCGDFGDSGGSLILAFVIKTDPAGVFAVGTLTGRPPGAPVGCGTGIQGDTMYAPIQSALDRFNATLLVH